MVEQVFDDADTIMGGPLPTVEEARRDDGASPTPASMVDLFAGPGGLDVAACWLGIPAHGIEWDSNACATRAAAGLATTQGDVRLFGPADFPDATILAGGPPCQTFTMAGNGAGRRALELVTGLVKKMAAHEDVTSIVADLDDERTGLVLEPLRWALEAHALDRPYKAIVLEQVPAVLPVWGAVREALEAIGYKGWHGILHTEEYGVPQTRRRAILIARLDRRPHCPQPTHHRFRSGAPRPVEGLGLLPWETMGQALRRKGAFTVISNYGSGGDPKARGRRRSDEPAATVTGKVSRNRLTGPGAVGAERLTHDEAGRLQTFPRDYPWSGKDIAQQIGNAIPPRLAAHVLIEALRPTLPAVDLDQLARGLWVGNTAPDEAPLLDIEEWATAPADAAAVSRT